MKLADVIIFTFAVCSFIIGVHQTFVVGMMASYWLFMISLALLLWFRSRKSKQKLEVKNPERDSLKTKLGSIKKSPGGNVRKKKSN